MDVAYLDNVKLDPNRFILLNLSPLGDMKNR